MPNKRLHRHLARTLAQCAVLLLFSLALAAGAAGAEPNPSGGLTDDDVRAFADEIVPRRLGDSRVPGALFAVVHRGRVLLAQGYGMADVESKVPVNAQTLFRVGSLSKIVTATAVMRLAAAGRIDLDADVEKTLPDLDLPRRYPDAVTARQLLTHSSGFDVTDIADASRTVDGALPLAEVCRHHMTAQVFRPGEFFRYTNHGFALLGCLVEKAADEPFAAAVRAQVFEPLGMRSSTFEQPAAEALQRRLARGHALEGNRVVSLPMDYSNVAPADVLMTTAGDMAAFMIAHLENREASGAAFLSEAALADMHATHFAAHPRLPGRALGFDEERVGADRGALGKRRFLSHTGAQLGFTSELLLFPDAHLGLFIVLNRRDWHIRRDIFDAFLARFFPPGEAGGPAWSAPATAEQTAALSGTYEPVPEPLSTLEGAPAIFEPPAHVSTGASLVVDRGGGRRYEMRHLGELAFATSDGKTRLAFGRGNGDRAPTHLVLDGHVFARPVWYASAALHKLIVLGSVLLSLLGLLGWPTARWIWRRKRDESPRERRAGRIVALACGLHLAYVVAIVAAIAAAAAGGGFDYGLPAGMVLVLWSPVILLVFTAVLVALSVEAWRRPFWNVVMRIALSVTSATYVLFVMVLFQRHLVGS